MQKGSCFYILFLLSCVALFGVSCASTGTQLSWRASDDVEMNLAEGKMLPQFSYYYSGSESQPHTIIAIRKNVSFKQSLWQPASSSAYSVREWLEAIDNPHRPVNDRYFGGELLGEEGDVVGMWYSKHRFLVGYFNANDKLVVPQPLKKKGKRSLLKYK